ncbi:hypothetical protein [Vibrio sp. D431a]|uniref:hypothetical protein n=1 Tax=Vibrio sp. D431a TaxID=2837388 RepID=UPI002554602D|nr:hypothetical protein [Vibrio sp. D431a]MDK9793800.1 hypothetical protein [Vibrio sp. D431a]
MITTATPCHAENERIQLIRQEEGAIVILKEELSNADPKHWRTKESQKMLESALAKKDSLIAHYEEVFGKTYNKELNQLLSEFNHNSEMAKNILNDEWRVASMMTVDEAEELAKQYEARMCANRKELKEKHNYEV